MDKSNYLDEVFFVNDGVTAKGQNLLNILKAFHQKVNQFRFHKRRDSEQCNLIMVFPRIIKSF